MAVTPEGFPKWAAGERVVAFRYKPAARTGLQTTAGLAQGKLRMADGRVSNEFNNQGLFEDVQIQEAGRKRRASRMLSCTSALPQQ